MVIAPLCGMLVAGLLSAAWLALGSPTPAQGAVWFQVVGTGDSQFANSPDKPFFFLALGNDGRTDADKGLGDAIHVIGVNPALHEATILNVPRDTTAPAGDKINAYHALNGLPGIVDQLNKMMGISISYAITTNFPGFMSMVDEIGGVDLTIPEITANQDSVSLGGDRKWDDTYTGAYFTPGPQHLNGTQTLAFARDRHDFNLLGDIARTGDQSIIILSALAMLRAQNPGDAGALRLTAILARHVRMLNVDPISLFRLGRLALTIDPANVKSITIPVGSGQGTNLVVGAGGAALFRDFADDAIVETAG